MITSVARIYRFRGQHSLLGFPEPWCFPHQHDYTVEVVAAGGTPTDDLDMAFRIRGVRRDDATVVDVNALVEPSTVENLAAYWLDLLAETGAEQVTVWEDAARWGRAEL